MMQLEQYYIQPPPLHRAMFNHKYYGRLIIYFPLKSHYLSTNFKKILHSLAQVTKEYG